MAEEILVLRLSSLGDVVLASSFLRSCREHFPSAHVTFVVRDDLAELAAALPGVERVVAVPRRLGIAALLRLGAELARRPYAHVFDLHHGMRSRLLVRGLGARRRDGFGKQALPRWVLVHLHRDIYGRYGGSRPLRARMLEPLRGLGLHPQLHDTQIVVPAAARQRAEALLRAAGVRAGELLIGVAPGARWPSKCWPAERYAALLRRLAESTDLRFLLVGGAAERPLAFITALGAPERCLDLSGQIDVLETAAILERCAALLGNDSGLLHVAEAVGRPVLAFFGPTAPEFGYAPYRAASRLLRQPPPCSPCSKNGSRPCSRPTHECMENISVEAAYTAAGALLEDVRRLQSS